MQLGRGRSCTEGGLGFIASFPLCPSFPVEADAVITRLALTFTVVTFWSFFTTFDLSILAGPVVFSTGRWTVTLFPRLPTTMATPLLGLGASWLLRSRHVDVEGVEGKLMGGSQVSTLEV